MNWVTRAGHCHLCTPGLVPSMKGFSGIKQMWGLEDKVTAEMVIRSSSKRFLLGHKIKWPTCLEAPQKPLWESQHKCLGTQPAHLVPCKWGSNLGHFTPTAWGVRPLSGDCFLLSERGINRQSVYKAERGAWHGEAHDFPS